MQNAASEMFENTLNRPLLENSQKAPFLIFCSSICNLFKIFWMYWSSRSVMVSMSDQQTSVITVVLVMPVTNGHLTRNTFTSWGNKKMSYWFLIFNFFFFFVLFFEFVYGLIKFFGRYKLSLQPIHQSFL